MNQFRRRPKAPLSSVEHLTPEERGAAALERMADAIEQLLEQVKDIRRLIESEQEGRR